MHSAIDLIKALHDQGFLYLRTKDDGDTWTGSNRSGLPIVEWMRLQSFRGQVVLDPARDNPSDRSEPGRQ